MGETILVVDDEPDVVDLVRYHLRRAGFDVLVAFTGPAGLATATESRPDAIVLDIMLPQMTGIEVCKALRQGNETSEIPILILTAKAELPERIAGFRAWGRRLHHETVQPSGIGFACAEPATAPAERAKFIPAVWMSSVWTRAISESPFGKAIRPDDHRIRSCSRGLVERRGRTLSRDPITRRLGLQERD
jgi:CheY-like chemotaxis protein